MSKISFPPKAEGLYEFTSHLESPSMADSQLTLEVNLRKSISTLKVQILQMQQYETLLFTIVVRNIPISWLGKSRLWC